MFYRLIENWREMIPGYDGTCCSITCPLHSRERYEEVREFKEKV